MAQPLRCFLWHEPVYVPGWTEVLSPRDLAFPCPCLACSITASPAHLLHLCAFCFSWKRRGKNLSLPQGDQGLPEDQRPPRGLLKSFGA